MPSRGVCPDEAKAIRRGLSRRAAAPEAAMRLTTSENWLKMRMKQRSGGSSSASRLQIFTPPHLLSLPSEQSRIDSQHRLPKATGDSEIGSQNACQAFSV